MSDENFTTELKEQIVSNAGNIKFITDDTIPGLEGSIESINNELIPIRTNASDAKDMVETLFPKVGTEPLPEGYTSIINWLSSIEQRLATIEEKLQNS